MRVCPAPDCSCLWLDPCPSPEDIGRAYATYYTHAARPAWIEEALVRVWALLGQVSLAGAHGRAVGPVPAVVGRALAPLIGAVPTVALHLGLLLRHLPPPTPGMTLLDVGCGDGLALRILEKVGWRVEGQDVDPTAVAGAVGRGLRVRQGPLDACGFRENNFDAVTSSHVLEHVHDPEALLHGMHRLLSPGGVLVAVTPNVRSANHERFGRSWRSLEPPRHLQIFSAEALAALAERVGFRHCRVASTVHGAAAGEVASRHIQARGRHQWDDAGTWADRLAGWRRQRAQIRSGDAARLRGDELVLTATK
jgi:2-polyprenyl-3-methyl-5-hydroxy-6-metoxy-1,4-benzoquinol methylase